MTLRNGSSNGTDEQHGHAEGGDHDGHDHDHHDGHDQGHPQGHLHHLQGGAQEDAEEEEFVIGEVPAQIHELAEGCRQFVLSALKVELDYDAETLPVLDEYVRIVRKSVADRPEAELVVTRSVAAYFGEVIRRRIDGFWRRSGEGPADANTVWLLAARRAYLSMSPLGMVLETLADGGEHAGPSAALDFPEDERATVEGRLAVFPPVSEDQYYLLSTRLEVIEVVYEALRDRMKSDGRESLVYDEADYSED